MPKENNKIQVDIENLFKQNANDLSSIKELYSKLKEVEEKITQVKYIDNTLVKKLKKEYEKLKKIILDENIQIKITNDIETIISQLDTKANVNETYIISKQMPKGYVNFIKNDTSNAAQTQNSNALQYYFDNVELLNNQKLVFEQGVYYFNKTVVKKTNSLITLIGNSNGKSGKGLTELKFTGSGTFITVGEDDGEPENSNLYNGVGALHIKDMLISGMADGSLVSGANYGIGQYGIRDYRGGKLKFEDVTIQQFECGLWVIESDFNTFYNLCLRANKLGAYIGARSDQQTFISLDTYNNDIAIEFNGCSGVSLLNPFIVANASNKGQILINNSKGTTDVTFLKGWYEMHQLPNVNNYSDSLINIGDDFNVNNPLKVVIDSPTINNSKHKHFLKIKYCSNITLNNIETNGYYNLFNFIGTTNDYTSTHKTNIYCNNSPTTKGVKDFTISGDKTLVRILGNSYSYGVNQIALGEQNRLDFINPTSSNTLEMFLDYGSTGLRFNHTSFNGGKYLQFEKRLFYRGTIPDETNISYSKGDICFNKNATVGGYVGWVCVSSGTPGIWKGFGLIEE